MDQSQPTKRNTSPVITLNNLEPVYNSNGQKSARITDFHGSSEILFALSTSSIQATEKSLGFFNKISLYHFPFCRGLCLVFAMPLYASVYTCWERADLLALVCGVLL